MQTQLFVTRLPWYDFVLWAPGGQIHVEKIFMMKYLLMKARAFYFDKFLPSVVPYFIISQSYEHITAHIGNDILKKKVHVSPIKARCEDVEILSVSLVRRQSPLPTNVLQQLNRTQHTVFGDGNCLYYAIAHRAGYIDPISHGDSSVGQQLRMLALIIMQKYPDVRIEEGLSQPQWEKKKMAILQSSEWVVI